MTRMRTLKASFAPILMNLNACMSNPKVFVEGTEETLQELIENYKKFYGVTEEEWSQIK